MSRIAPLALALVAGCHVHGPMTPGHVDVARPPAAIASERVELPGDPGERMVMVTPGVVALGGGGSVGRGVGDLELEVGVHLGDAAISHNDHAAGDRLFMPRGLLVPEQSVGIVAGWTALRVLGATDDGAHDTDLTTGPLHVRGQVAQGFWGGGAGWFYDPRTASGGPEVSLWAMLTELRVAVSTEGDVLFLLGLQLKWPVTFVTGRR